ncbi:DUF2520 domain-containing protein [Paludibacter sp. 221]|uniref:Rossmann-like and DUF2520 domain-containing protein n=1 Tax=Paludibacter sp. 221 TaxID=2302939 RepID=UPI0013D55B7D|nr:Rossmann-like and DUF2520 domain-containing protein [Paludibacter sp. 221]NDV46964.1 DUF2520 domain-containing protein [Paludibacter sp. 221]
MKIVFIGAGNVAVHLATALNEKGFDICQVFSRTQASAKHLADKIKSEYTTELSQVRKDVDVYIYSVSDNALTGIISLFQNPDTLHIHTSGSIPMSVFAGAAENYGVLYPLQTFSKVRAVDFSEIPVFIEAANRQSEEVITKMAQELTAKIHFTDSESRKKLHLSAVFACNFVNHMYEIGSELVKDAGFDFEVLRPLVEETYKKVQVLSPFEAQTGPAVRNDSNVIEKHLDLLAGKRNLDELYKFISEDIYSVHKS